MLQKSIFQIQKQYEDHLANLSISQIQLTLLMNLTNTLSKLVHNLLKKFPNDNSISYRNYLKGNYAESIFIACALGGRIWNGTSLKKRACARGKGGAKNKAPAGKPYVFSSFAFASKR